MITIYTTSTCPKCKILKKKLDDKGIAYEEFNDEDEMQRMGILSVPIMSVDGRLMEFPEAIKYVNER
jgi:glutaredoxin